MIAFADTSYYVALLQPSDSLHKRALEITQSFRGRMITTEWILTELGNFLSPVTNRASFVSLVSTLRNRPTCQSFQSIPDTLKLD